MNYSVCGIAKRSLSDPYILYCAHDIRLFRRSRETVCNFTQNESLIVNTFKKCLNRLIFFNKSNCFEFLTWFSCRISQLNVNTL